MLESDRYYFAKPATATHCASGRRENKETCKLEHGTQCESCSSSWIIATLLFWNCLTIPRLREVSSKTHG